jgi:hypothetical protein
LLLLVFLFEEGYTVATYLANMSDKVHGTLIETKLSPVGASEFQE